jgi:tetratricopeptide (TPR) repeat protein/TM2 domain-containing membrane protein YozV
VSSNGRPARARTAAHAAAALRRVPAGATRAPGAALLFGFGTDGADRLLLPWLAQNLAALFTILLSIVLIALLLLVVGAVVRELRRNTVFLDPIQVPARLAARGYTPEVLSERLLDALLGLQRDAPTLKELRGVDSSAALVDLQVPGRFSLQAIVRYLHRLLRIPEVHIAGEVTWTGDAYELVLRNRDQRRVAILATERSADIGALLRAGAEAILRQVDPWILAHHYFALEDKERPAVFARTTATLQHMLQHAPAAERPWALNMQGICLMNQQRLPEACARFAEAVAAGPGLPIIHQNWAVALERMGRHDEARAHRLQALGTPGRTANLLGAQAVLAAALHRRDQALALARQALAKEPENGFAWVAWGCALLAVHRPAQAAAALERAAALGARGENWAAPLAFACAALGDAERALVHARDAVARDASDDEALVALGRAHLAAGDPAAALEAFEAARAAAPRAADAAVGKGDALRALGRPEAAVPEYERAVALDPEHPQAQAGWGCALAALGRHAEAIARFEQAARLDADDPATHDAWASSLAAAGREADAARRRERAAAVAARNRALLPLR